jgi:exosortase/archaeosortase
MEKGINVSKYLKEHEAYIKARLAAQGGPFDWQGLKLFHKTRIEFFQHERLIHLLVTLAVAILLFIALNIAVNRPVVEMAAIIALLLILLIPYIYHYFILENGVQRWYKLYDEIEKRAGDK